ncbi:pollen receptor-like kinase 2 [Rutidosis leptorrhynchoides]|uniref:pollen receptor-like kinase 2 n=1 Tax=Rutidosis leptorrhynchoides TaxID=125765 RepID=UPI003A994EE6
MGAHLYVRAPLSTSSSSPMWAHFGRFIVFLLILTISTMHLANASDFETLIEFKKSISGYNLTTWNTTMTPCDNNVANWEGLLCTNGTVWGIELEGKGLKGNIDTYILGELSSLVSISFNDNNLEGHFPDFGMLDGLREISLSDNNFNGEISANAFNGLKWLKKINLANNNLVGQIPRSLIRLPKLQELMLQDNQFEGELPHFDPGKLSLANFANNHFRGRIPEGLQSFPASQFSGNDLCGIPLAECQRDGTATTTVIIIVLVLATSLAALVWAIIILCRRRHHELPSGYPHNSSIILTASANLSTHEKGETSAQNGNKPDLTMKLTFLTDDEHKFELKDLLKASAEILGSGMFGSSYKIDLKDGNVMVVKRFKQMNNFGKEEFCDHIKRLGRLRHPNIQPIVAFHYRKDEKLLVSEYVDNISLSYHLHGNQSNESQSLDWPTRLKIVKGVVKGLQNLYTNLPSLIVPHGHLKSSNVLLNKNYEPLLTDYGLVPVTNQEHARDFMMAYKSPEYQQLSRISKKTDIWCLGVLILEIMTGKFPPNTLHQSKGHNTDLTDFINYISEQFSVDMFDKEMSGFGKSREGEMMKLFKIGLSCCEKDVKKRIDIQQLVMKIEDVKERDGPEDDFQSTYNDFQSTYSSE